MFWEVSYIRLSKTKYLQQHLQKFLVLYHKLDIPQVGSFTIDTEPARLDAASGLLFAPRPVIHFKETAKPAPDKLFFNFLVEEMGTDEVSAIREFHEFCFQFREDLVQKDISVLPGVGRIVRRGEGELIFTPESTLLELLPPVAWSDSMPGGQKKTAKIAPVQEAKPESKQEPKIEMPRITTPAPTQEVALQPIAAPVAENPKEPDPVWVSEEEEESEEVVTSPDRWWIYAIILLVGGILAILYNYR
jgi:hypothetical protein